MARLPFDPDRIASSTPAPAQKPKSGQLPALTVTQANRLVKDTLARTLPAKLRIVGQVSNFSDRAHWFFSLKDAGSSLRCVCFASVARKSRLPMADGLEVVLTGRFDVYDAQGQLQFYVDKIEPVGQGALELQYRALCEKLRGLGYFDSQSKLPLPVFPRRVAVVTSRAAAALQDVINTAAQRWQGCELFLVDVRVQGAEAAGQIAKAIHALSAKGRSQGIDAIILTRGGGSIEDLWAFNEQIVADAIHQCSLPIVAAIGHETDTTIAELVADVRCATPTQAAMTLIPDRQMWDQQLDQHLRRLRLLMGRQMDSLTHRVSAAARHSLFRNPVNMLAPLEDRTERLHDQLQQAITRQLTDRQRDLTAAARHLATISPAVTADDGQRQLKTLAARLSAVADRVVTTRQDRLTALSRHLAAVGPGKVLARGYTYTTGAKGKPIASAKGVKPGDQLVTVFADGKVASRVEGAGGDVAPESTVPTPAASPRRPRRKKPASKKTQGQSGSLFDAVERPSSES